MNMPHSEECQCERCVGIVEPKYPEPHIQGTAFDTDDFSYKALTIYKNTSAWVVNMYVTNNRTGVTRPDKELLHDWNKSFDAFWKPAN